MEKVPINLSRQSTMVHTLIPGILVSIHERNVLFQIIKLANTPDFRHQWG